MPTAHILLREETPRPSPQSAEGKTPQTPPLQKGAAAKRTPHGVTHTAGTWQSIPGVPGTAEPHTYNFELNKQLVDICHVSQDEQAGDSGEQRARGPHHVPALHRRAGVICKLPRCALHQVTCTGGQQGLASASHCIASATGKIPKPT